MVKQDINTQTTTRIKRQRDNLLDETLLYTGTFDTESIFELVSYNSEHVSHNSFKNIDNLIKALKPDRINWIMVRGLSDTNQITAFGHKLKIPTLWLQDIVNARDTAKIEFQHQQMLTLIDQFIVKPDTIPIKQHCSLYLSSNTVIWFQEDEHPLFREIIKAIKNNRGKVRSKDSGYLYNLLISNIVDQYLILLDDLRNKLIDLEDYLLELHSDTKDVMNQLQGIRKAYMLIRKSILPFKEHFKRHIENECEFINTENLSYFKDTHDHLQQVYLLIDNTKEMITSLIDLSMANNDRRLNNVIRQLTIVSVVFIPLTFMAGVWGMNFAYMPELNWHFGYLFAWISMILVTITTIIVMKHKHWLK